jgi:antitoxin VapB
MAGMRSGWAGGVQPAMVEFGCKGTMALNIKNPDVEKLAADVADLAGETKTEAIRKSLAERKLRLELAAGKQDRTKELLEFFERDVWPKLPADVLGRKITRQEEEQILGFGPDGV